MRDLSGSGGQILRAADCILLEKVAKPLFRQSQVTLWNTQRDLFSYRICFMVIQRLERENHTHTGTELDTAMPQAT